MTLPSPPPPPPLPPRSDANAASGLDSTVTVTATASGGWRVVGAHFQVYSADSSRLLSSSCFPPSPLLDNAHHVLVRVDWAQGYTPAPHSTNEWMDTSVPRDLAFARLALVLAPATHVTSTTPVLCGGLTRVHGHPDRTWAWGSPCPPAHDAEFAPQFYTRLRPMHPDDPTCLVDVVSGEPAQVFPRAIVSLQLHWSTTSPPLRLARVSRFATPLWHTPDPPPAAADGLCNLMVLPDVEAWQDADACHGLADYSLTAVSPPMGPRVPCAWSDSMAALVTRALGLPAHAPSPPAHHLCHAATTRNDWDRWTRATHSFDANLAQFHPDNAHVAASHACTCSVHLRVTPAAAAASAPAPKPYRAAELRCPAPLTPRAAAHVFHVHAAMRAAATPGLVSAVFLYSDPTQEEIDIVEVTGNRPREPQVNWYATGARQPPGATRRLTPGWNAAEDLHVYGVAWRPGHAVVWLVDHRPVARVVSKAAPRAKTPGGKVKRLLHSVLHTAAPDHGAVPDSAARAPAGYAIPGAPTTLMLNTWPSKSGHEWAGVLDKRAIAEGRPEAGAEYADACVWTQEC